MRALCRWLLISSNVALYDSGNPASEGGAVKRASTRARPRAKRTSVSRGTGGFNFDDFLVGTKSGGIFRLRDLGIERHYLPIFLLPGLQGRLGGAASQELQQVGVAAVARSWQPVAGVKELRAWDAF